MGHEQRTNKKISKLIIIHFIIHLEEKEEEGKRRNCEGKKIGHGERVIIIIINKLLRKKCPKAKSANEEKYTKKDIAKATHSLLKN